MTDILAIHAVEGEHIDLHLDGARITQLLTGVGKAQTAILLTRQLCLHKPRLVINYGSAGTLRHAVGDILVCRHFADRDLSPIAIPHTGEPISTAHLLRESGLCTDWHSLADVDAGYEALCSTGDSFVTDAQKADGDVVDMEAYAAALACRIQGVPFISVKYVTDIVGQNSLRAWEEKLADARTGLARFFATHTLY
ncbi:MAG: hypothetical protein NC388_01290 [Clostridium sp.]|nr:hypothetical protein [Clostridium sp.]